MAVIPGADQLVYTTAPTTPGWREMSMMKMIINTSPQDYPLFTLSGNVPVRDIKHHWHKRRLPTRSYTIRKRGDEHSSEDLAEPTIVTNNTMILEHGVLVDGSAAAASYHGADKLIMDQLTYRAAQHKGAWENAFWNATLAAGDATTAPEMNGVTAAITTNSVDNGGAGNILTEVKYLDDMQTLWEYGVQPKHCFTNSNLRRVIIKFDGQTSNSKEVPAKLSTIFHDVVFYVGPFGTVENMLTRDLDNDLAGDTAELVMMDVRVLKKGWFRPTFRKAISTDYDGFHTAILTEGTLQYDDEGAMVHRFNIADV